MKYITASKLYDYLECPHRIWRDVYGPEEERIKETNPFVEMLWQKGIQHEDKTVSSLGEYLDLSDGSLEERFQKTIEAMKKETLIIGIPILFFSQKNKNSFVAFLDIFKTRLSLIVFSVCFFLYLFKDFLINIK